MTQTLEAPASKVNDPEQYLAYSLPEAPPTTEDLVRQADTLSEGLNRFSLIKKPEIEPEAQLTLLLDLVPISVNQQEPLDERELATFKDLIVSSALEVASGRHTVAIPGTGKAETVFVEPELIDAYLLEKAASVLEAYPDDQRVVLEACTTVAEKINNRTPGLTEGLLKSIERYIRQDEAPISPENPRHHATLTEVLESIEHPLHNQAMDAYARRQAELGTLEGTLGDGAPAPRFAPPSERWPRPETLRVDYAKLRRDRELAKAARLREARPQDLQDAYPDDAVKMNPADLLDTQSSSKTKAA